MRRIFLLLLLSASLVGLAYAEPHEGCFNAYNNNASNCDAGEFFVSYLAGSAADKCKDKGEIDDLKSTWESQSGAGDGTDGNLPSSVFTWSCVGGSEQKKCFASNVQNGVNSCSGTCRIDSDADGIADFHGDNGQPKDSSSCGAGESYNGVTYCGGIQCVTTKVNYLSKFADNNGAVGPSVLYQEGINISVGGTTASLGSGSTPYSQQLKVDVTGAIGASYYCDAAGENCVDGSSLGGLSTTCLTDGDILKWNGSVFTCQPDDAGDGALPTRCDDSQIARYEADPDNDPGTNDGTWSCRDVPAGADGLEGTNGIVGADGLVGQSGSAFDANACDNGEVLTWGTGEFNDYDGDDVLTAADNTNDVAGLESTDQAWFCDAVDTADINYWTKTGTDLSYDKGVVSIQGAAATDLVDRSDSLEVSYSSRGGGSALQVWDGPVGNGTTVPYWLDGGGNIDTKRFTEVTADFLSFETANTVSVGSGNIPTSALVLDVGGKIGAVEYCGDTAADLAAGKCITKNVLTSMNGTTDGTVDCDDGSSLLWDKDFYGTGDGGWKCVVSGSNGTVIFSGVTAVKTGDSMGGYASANLLCGGSSGVSAGARVCTTDDILAIQAEGSLSLGVGISQAWINAGPPGHMDLLTNDCRAWNSDWSALRAYGSVVLSSGEFKIQQCNMGVPFACCE